MDNLAPGLMTNEELAALIEEDVPRVIALAEGEFGVGADDAKWYSRMDGAVIEAARRLRSMRAPGPPTDAEMDRAVAAYIEVARSQTWFRSTDPQQVASHLADFHRVLVRAALTAALGAPE